MNRVRVKVCGITQLQDALMTVAAGADALGFVFYAPSPRAVTAEQAADICRALPPYVAKVGLFVNADAERVREVLAAVELDCLQFHGDETQAFCQQFAKPWYKAIRVANAADIVTAQREFGEATALLLDAFVPGVPGGTGVAFDWQLVRQVTGDQAVILAGGLTPDNLEQAIRLCAPYAVDVSGGVERVKGRKCPEKVRQFVSQAWKSSQVES